MVKQAIGTADVVDGPYTHLTDRQPFNLSKKDLSKLVHHYVKEALEKLKLHEAAGGTRILYHIGPRPARPHKKKHAGEQWHRSWIKSDSGPVVFLSDNWIGVWANHGIRGNVYAYKVPVAAIRDSGGLRRFDFAREVLIPEKVWEKYNLQNSFLGKVTGEREAYELVDKARITWSLVGAHRSGEKPRGKPKVTDFESLLRFDAGKQKEVIKLMLNDTRKEMLSRLENWLDEVDIPGYKPKVEYPWNREGLADFEKRIAIGSAKLKHETKLAKVKELQKILKDSLK